MTTVDPNAHRGSLGFPGRPNEPFFFGRGGKRRTAEDIALERRLAAQQLATGADFSPVQHWTQGLARVANGVAGGLRMRGADKMAEERAAGQQQSIEALLANYDPASGAPDPVAAALADPELRQLGMAMLEARTPKPVQPTEFERLLTARGIVPGSPEWNTSLDRYISGKSDPIITVTLPGGGIFNGPQSELANVLQGGRGQVPSGSPPATLPPDFNFDEPVSNDDGGRILQNALQRGSITRADANRALGAFGPNGQAEFNAWVRTNNIRVTD